MASLPLAAPFTPPETGASMAAMPWGARMPAMACAAAGPEVERSTKMRAPPASATALAAAFASAGPGTLAITTLVPCAAALMDVAARAPRSTKGATAAGLGSNSVSSWPAAMRRPTIPEPILPTPMKATFSPTFFPRFSVPDPRSYGTGRNGGKSTRTALARPGAAGG